MGKEGGRLVIPWSGHPQPKQYETWKCSVLSEWETGMMVAPLSRIA